VAVNQAHCQGEGRGFESRRPLQPAKFLVDALQGARSHPSPPFRTATTHLDAMLFTWMTKSRGSGWPWREASDSSPGRLIARPVETSDTLTSAGRETVLWAIDQLRRLFEDEWLADAGSDGVDIMTSWMFSPTNTSEHVQ